MRLDDFEGCLKSPGAIGEMLEPNIPDGSETVCVHCGSRLIWLAGWSAVTTKFIRVGDCK